MFCLEVNYRIYELTPTPDEQYNTITSDFKQSLLKATMQPVLILNMVYDYNFLTCVMYLHDGLKQNIYLFQKTDKC